MSPEDTQGRSTARIGATLLCVAAAVLIVSILSGSDFDGITRKVLSAVAVFPVLILCAVAGLRLMERRPGLSVVGLLTIAIAAVAYLAFLDSYWRDGLVGRHETVAILVILALASAQVSIVLSFGRDDDGPLASAAVYGSLAGLGLLSVLAMIEVTDPGGDVSSKAMAIAAIVYVLGVILTPLLRRAEFEER